MSSQKLDGKSWDLIYSKPKREKFAQENLARQGYETYLPLIRNKRRVRSKNVELVEPLFPRYLFIRLNKTTDNWPPIRSTIGVARIVEFDYIPAQVPDSLVSTVMQNGNEAGFQWLPEYGYKPGDTIRITAGPMEDYQGLFMAQTSKTRVVILLSMLG